MEEERPPDSGPISELPDPPAAAAVERTTSDISGPLLDRITELEGREYALDAQLVTVRADLDRLRRQLDQDLTLMESPALFEAKPTFTQREVDQPLIPFSAPLLSQPASANGIECDAPGLAADGSPMGPVLPLEITSPAASEIDDLIQAAVASRDRDTGIRGRSSVLPGEVAVSDTFGLDGMPMPANQEAASSDDEQNPSVGGIDDFFLRPSSSRKGRN